MLYPDPIPLETITIIKLLFPGCLPRRGVEEGISEALLIITTYYYSMLHQLMLHCYYLHAIITVGRSLLMLQESIEDANLR